MEGSEGSGVEVVLNLCCVRLGWYGCVGVVFVVVLVVVVIVLVAMDSCCVVLDLRCVAGKVQDGQRECGFKSTTTSGDWNPGVATTVDGRHPLNHPGCNPVEKKGFSRYQRVDPISSINSISCKMSASLKRRVIFHLREEVWTASW